MKSINVYFENEEFERLSKEKGDLSWHDFILKLIDKKPKQKSE